MGSLPDSLKAYPVQDEFCRQPKNPNARDASKKKTFLRHAQPLANSDPSSISVDLPGKGTLLSSLCARVSEVSACSKSDPGNLDVLERGSVFYVAILESISPQPQFSRMCVAYCISCGQIINEKI